MRTLLRLCSILLLAAAPLHSWAQTSSDSQSQSSARHFYRLVFRIQEVNADGKVTNTRTYSSTAGSSDSRLTSIRTGTKFPLHSGDKGDVINYTDVGVNIDCDKPMEVDGQFTASVTIDLTSLPTGVPSNGIAPLVRQNRWRSDVKVPLGKPTVIFSSDNLNDTGKAQVELTATRMD